MEKLQKEVQFLFPNQIGNKGISLLEILITIGIFSFVAVFLFSLTNFSLKSFNLLNQTFQANYLAKEAIEGVRNFRDGTIWEVNGLGKVSTNLEYHLQATSSPLRWELVKGEEIIGKFKRKIIFQDVFRDANSNIVESGGNYDPNTKKVIVRISWPQEEKIHQIEIITYLTNWRK